MSQRDTDRRPGLVGRRVRLQPQIGLGGQAHVAEPGLTGVAGAGVDARQVDHALSLFGQPIFGERGRSIENWDKSDE